MGMVQMKFAAGRVKEAEDEVSHGIEVEERHEKEEVLRLVHFANARF